MGKKVTRDQNLKNDWHLVGKLNENPPVAIMMLGSLSFTHTCRQETVLKQELVIVATIAKQQFKMERSLSTHRCCGVSWNVRVFGHLFQCMFWGIFVSFPHWVLMSILFMLYGSYQIFLFIQGSYKPQPLENPVILTDPSAFVLERTETVKWKITILQVLNYW